jgi:hypothetical protein
MSLNQSSLQESIVIPGKLAIAGATRNPGLSNASGMTERGAGDFTKLHYPRTPEAFAVWVAMASISAGDRQS